MALNCVYLALIASTVVLGFVEPTAGGFCDGKHNGDYNDPNNCYGFITCSNGIPYKRDCPDHLKFDQATDRCEYNVDCFPVDGGWSDWSPWYPCSVSCGGGKQLKFRTCTNPRPSHGGKYCVGPNKLSRVCNRQPCPGGFCYGKPNGDYSDPDNCYGFITCSNGIAYKRDCPDHLKFNQTTDRCEHNVDCFPVDGGWSDWSPWYPCSVSCGGGKQLKFRTCTNPRPSHGGKYCVGPNKLSRVCNRQTCPFSCRHQQNGDYTDHENPHGFITCSNGLTYHRECPANLIFDERKDECDWPPNVDG